MDAKKKWWERSVVVLARGKRSTLNVDDAQLEPRQSSHPIDQATPGAVAVHGPGYRGGGDDEDDEGDVSTVQVGGGGDNGEDEASEAPLQVDSYAVNVGPTDEEIRQRILSGTPHAEAVTALADEPKNLLDRATALLIVAAVVVVAVVVGVTVPLATRSQPEDPSAQGQEDVVASFKYLEWQGSGGFASSIQARTRRINGGMVTSGLVEMIGCRIIPCMDSSDICGGGTYSPGCCAGADCPNETKCGASCPMPPKSCFLTDPDNETCIRSSCYTCNQEDGHDVYELIDHVVEIDCLAVGTAVRPENGQMYKWAIYCGPVIVRPVVEQDRDLGEYQCAALRLGANFTDDGGGLLSGAYPCQYISLAECGCGPSDMYTFWLPDPTGPCVPGGDCPFLCEDAGPTYARNLCHAFPGNISWWEGQNVFNASLFGENVMAPEYEFDIYIEGIDDSVY